MDGQGYVKTDEMKHCIDKESLQINFRHHIKSLNFICVNSLQKKLSLKIIPVYRPFIQSSLIDDLFLPIRTVPFFLPRTFAFITSNDLNNNVSMFLYYEAVSTYNASHIADS